MCKKQTAVSHSSTESEIISLDTGLRLDGLLALELWDLIVSVLVYVSRVSDGSGQPDSDVHKRHKPHKKIDAIKDIDAVRKKMVISKIVMTRISSTLRWMTRTLISTSPMFPMRR